MLLFYFLRLTVPSLVQVLSLDADMCNNLKASIRFGFGLSKICFGQDGVQN